VESEDACERDGGSNPLQVPFGVLGLSHKSAALELLSLIGLTKDQIPRFLARAKEAGAAECAVLSTCNRVDVYYSGCDAKVALQLLADHAGVEPELLNKHAYSYFCLPATNHLFRVTAGLDSAVLGETEIVAQVKEARSLAEEAGTMGPMLGLLFQRAMEANKRIRTETDLCKIVVSVASLAVREACLGLDTSDYKVAILGAGKLSARIAKEVVPMPRSKTAVVNRSKEHAEPIAKLLDAEISGFDSLLDTVAESDIVFAAVGAGHSVIEPCDLFRVMENRASRPLTIVDFGVPANIAPGVLPDGVHVIGLEELSSQSASNAGLKNDSLEHASAILGEEMERFGEALIERAASPTIHALMRIGDSVSKRNLAWALDKMPDLDERQVRTLEEMLRRTVLGLLEAPINTLKTDATWAERRELLENLFAIGGGE
jgi:glutamyl-tRNA reductase